MIFGMLLLGFFLLLLLLIGDYINGGGFFKLNLLSKLSDLELKLLVLIVPLSVVVLYSIGFVIYLGSFIFLSGPGWLLMKKIYRKSPFTSEKIFNAILPLSPSFDFYKECDLLFKRGAIYFLLRDAGGELSTDIKFTFTQLMFGRAVLFCFVLSSFFTLFSVGFTLFKLVLFLMIYLAAIIFYAVGLKFFDEVLSMGFLSKEILIKKSKSEIYLGKEKL